MASLLLSSLPRDILVDNIFPFLSIRDFLNFTATCKAFFSLSTDEVYWRKATSSTFRLPAQPIRKEGWKQLYRNLINAKLFTWGSNQSGRLGHSYPSVDDGGGMVMYGISIPMEVPNLERQTVVDVKAGGWSTTVLMSNGSVYSCGSLNSGRYPVGKTLNKLKFPDRRSSKIAQISSGRSHILGLSDEGQIWQWNRIQGNARLIKFVHQDTTAKTSFSGPGKLRGTVEKVVAGWNHSAALVNGVGIVVWFGEIDSHLEQGDAMLFDGEVVPGTHLTGLVDKKKLPTDPLASKIGDVIDLMGGEGFLVFLTRSGDVFAVDTSRPGSVAGIPPVQLTAFSAPVGHEPMSYISGSFQRFAVFNKGGLVYLGRKEMVQAAFQTPENVAGNTEISPEILPSLQNRHIVAIAFGDYHALALDSSGKVFSWGIESGTCGCLGLGVREVAKRRGVDYTHRDGVLKEPTEVYFGENAKPGKASSVSPQSGIFVFNIAAAGWHSAALALVPQSENRDGEGGIQKESRSSEKEAQVYPRSLLPPYRPPHHFNRPLGEAGHGGFAHRQSPAHSGPTQGIIATSPTMPFIRTGLALPMPESRPAPETTGRLHPSEEDPNQGEEEVGSSGLCSTL